MLDLLKRHNIKAVLVNIYFVGDKCSNYRKLPQNIAAWQKKIDDMKKYLNIVGLTTLRIKDLFLDIDK